MHQVGWCSSDLYDTVGTGIISAHPVEFVAWSKRVIDALSVSYQFHGFDHELEGK